MNPQESRLFRVRASGPLACFTRPEFKVERVSYEVMTPSAARGILEAVLWKPAIDWYVREITVLKPIRWASFRRNEVKSRLNPSRTRPYCADDDRTQRHTVALRDVDYVITASFCMTEAAGPSDSIPKFEEMFERRLSKGQHFGSPFLGCREFAAQVEPAPDEVAPDESLLVDRPIGMMLHDFDYGSRTPKPQFFEARLRNGILQVPAWRGGRR